MPLEPHVSDVLYPLLGRLHHMDPVLTAQEEAIASEDGASAADADAPARSALGDAATRNAFLEAVNERRAKKARSAAPEQQQDGAEAAHAAASETTIERILRHRKSARDSKVVEEYLHGHMAQPQERLEFQDDVHGSVLTCATALHGIQTMEDGDRQQAMDGLLDEMRLKLTRNVRTEGFTEKRYRKVIKSISAGCRTMRQLFGSECVPLLV